MKKKNRHYSAFLTHLLVQMRSDFFYQEYVNAQNTSHLILHTQVQNTFRKNVGFVFLELAPNGTACHTAM